ncbi:hypothetical protein DMENIID0001_113320 [Sergentomyia squamirostris]
MSKRAASLALNLEEKRKMLKMEALERAVQAPRPKLPAGYRDSDSESDEDDDDDGTKFTGMKDGKLHVRGRTMEYKLAKFVMEENISIASTKKLLRILRDFGHEELPTNKTTLVKENIDFTAEVMNVIKGIEKTLKAKLDFVMEQATKLETNLMLPDEAVETTKRYSSKLNMSDNKGQIHVFPITTTEMFEKLDASFEEDGILVRQVRDTIMSFPTDWVRLMFTDDVLKNYAIAKNGEKRSIFSFKIFQFGQKLTNYHDVVHQFRISRDRVHKRLTRARKLEQKAAEAVTETETEMETSTKAETDDLVEEDTEYN